MQKVKKYSKQILSVVLALVLTLAYVPMFSLNAEAAAGDYTFRFYVDTTTKCDNAKITVSYTYAGNNGTGNSTTVSKYINDQGVFSDTSADYTSNNITVAGFPTSMITNIRVVGAFLNTRTVAGTIYMQLVKADGSTINLASRAFECKSSASGSSYSESDVTTAVATNLYPKVSSYSISGWESGDSVYVPESGSVSYNLTIAATDQYGVEWVNAPTVTAHQALLNDATTAGQSATTKTPKLTYTDNVPGYDVEGAILQISYTDANSDADPTFYPSKNVYITRNMLFDNLFDFVEWRRAGITGNRATISDITATGFTITATDNDGYCYQSPSVTVLPDTTYTISADITGDVANSEIYAFFYKSDGTASSVLTHSAKSNSNSYTFTTPSDCVSVKFRFDSNVSGKSITVNNIRLVQEGSTASLVTVNPPAISASMKMNKKFSDYTAPIPTRPGYTFNGWYFAGALCYGPDGKWDSTAYGDLAIGGYTTTYRTDLYSEWTANKYKVLYDNMLDLSGWDVTNVSQGSTSEITDNGFTLTIESVQTGTYAEGYVKPCNKFPVTPGSTIYVSADMSGSAEDLAKANMFIFFYAADGTSISHKSAYSELLETTVPDNAAYATIRIGIAKLGAVVRFENIRIYEATNPVADGISYHASKEVTYDQTYGTLPEPTRPGYSFNGWYDADGNRITDQHTVKITSNSTLYSKWNPYTYTVTYEQNYGNYGSTNASFTAEDSVTLPTLTRPGYTHTGWTVKNAGGGNWSGTYTPGQVVTGMYGSAILTAQWAPVNYTITYDANGGSCSETTKSYTIEDTVTLPTPTKTGYTFLGWTVSSTDGNWSGTNLTGNVSSKYGAVTLTAQWKAIPYAITFVDWDGYVLQQTDVDYDSMPTPPANPSRDADNGYTYEFAGWDPTVVAVTGAATYTATYNATLIPYTITLDAGDGSVSTTTINYNYESTSYTLPDATKTGYTFTGWTVKSSVGSWTAGNTADGTLSNAYGNVTLVANYEANKYNVNYDANGGAIEDGYSAPFDVTYDGTVGALLSGDEVKRTGYTFAGWNTKADGTGKTVAAGDLWQYTDVATVYAQWDAIKYTITFITRDMTNNVANFVTAPNAITYTIEDDLSTILPDTTVEGYDFNYWLVHTTANVSGTSWKKNTTYATADLTTGNYGNVQLYMIYTAKSYTITWKNYDGTVLKTDTAYYGSTPSYDGAAPTKAPTEQYQYDFAGWSPDVSKVTGDQTYTATYTETTRKYTIKFVDHNGTVLSTQSLEYGATPTAPAAPTRESTAEFDYTFAGWTPTVANVTADATYTADYTATTRSYTITWIVDGKSSTTTVKYGEMPDFGSTPTKDADAQYTYSFLGWSTTENGVIADPVSVTGTATYYAVFGTTTNKYDVIWQNADGSTLETDKDVEYGATPSYDGATPEKAADAKYTYTFAGWDPEVNTVTGNVIYTATYTETVNKYTVTWVDEDGTLLKTDENVPYGTTPSYDGETPTKAATAEWTYTFSGWTPEVADVTRDITYTAQYTSSHNWYTITWDVNGTQTSKSYEYGTTPKFEGTTDKAADAQYTYTFAGWSPAVVAVTGNATYTATYTETVNKYTVTFYNDDGSIVLETQSVEYGKTPVYSGKEPTKPQADGKVYFFSGWASSVSGEVLNALPEVNGEMKFYAIFVSSDAKFNVVWKNADGTILETDENVEYGKAANNLAPAVGPEKDADAQYTYTFIGWNTVENSETALDLANVTVTSATTFYPAYSKVVNEYTITFVNEDGTVLQSSEVAYGEMPEYNGETPTKAADAQYTYTFASWDAEIVAVTGDATYTATYDSTVNKYTITFKNENGDVLQESEVAYGDTPSYTGETPTKTATAQYTYTWTGGWNTEIEAVTGEATYTATYDSTVNKYTIVFENENGDVLQKSEVEYGTVPTYTGATPTKAADAQYTYTFADWNTTPVAVTGTATYTATYDKTVNKYTIVFENEDGTVLQSTQVEYGTVPTYTGATPTKAATAQYTYTHSGWTPEVVAVTGDATYTAIFTETVRKYTITWVTGSGEYTGSWEYGSTPDPVTDNVDTSKAFTVSTDYAFASWDVEIVTVTGDATYTAQYTETTRKYTITWIVDGSETTENVEYGTVPTSPANPTKASTAQYEYTFVSWDNEVVAVVGDATYTAIFTESIRKYTITWVTGSGEYTGSWEYGSTPDPDVDNVDKSKAPTAEASYSFTGWDKTISTVTGAVTYTAKYDETVREYTVTYVVDGEILEEQTVAFGSDFNHPAIPAKEGHSSHWDVSFMTMPAQDITVIAVYTAKKYTVTWVADGNTVYEEQVAYGSAIPSKNVPEKVGHTGVWLDIPATMPAGAVTITAEYTVNTYSVTWTFTYGSGADLATYGDDYAVIFDVPVLPADVRITVGGNVLEAEYYSYDYETGELFITGTAIIGNISISEKAAEGYQNVVISAVNATLTNTTAIIAEGTAFHTQIVPEAGFLVPETVTVCIDGIELYEGYTYDANTGRLTINAEVMYGELSIRFECPVNPNYSGGNISEKCNCNCHSSSAFVRFFFSIANFFRKLFGMTEYRYCDCGTAHW